MLRVVLDYDNGANYADRSKDVFDFEYDIRTLNRKFESIYNTNNHLKNRQNPFSAGNTFNGFGRE